MNDFPKETKSAYNVPNLERGLMIIELLAKTPMGFTLTEIINQLDISKSSAFRITSTLIYKNYLQKNESTKKITLSRKMLTLGVSSVNEQSLVEVSIDVMRALRDDLKESVFLGILINNEGTILEQVTSSYPVKLSVELGTRYSIHSSVGGKSILAFLPSKESDAIIKKMTLSKFTDKTIVSKKEFRKVLSLVAEQGYAIDHGEDIDGINCIGAPILNEYGYPVAAIWISAPSGRLKSEDFIEKGQIVKQYAAIISEKLGFI